MAYRTDYSHQHRTVSYHFSLALQSKSRPFQYALLLSDCGHSPVFDHTRTLKENALR